MCYVLESSDLHYEFCEIKHVNVTAAVLVEFNRDFKISRRRRSTKTSPPNITWLYHKSFGIIQSHSRPTIWAKYPKNKLVRAVSE